MWIRFATATHAREPFPFALTDRVHSAGGTLVEEGPADDLQATIAVTLPTSPAAAESDQGP